MTTAATITASALHVTPAGASIAPAASAEGRSPVAVTPPSPPLHAVASSARTTAADPKVQARKILSPHRPGVAALLISLLVPEGLPGRLDLGAPERFDQGDDVVNGDGIYDPDDFIEMLNDEGIDLLEISGGTYEQPRLLGIDGLEPVFEEKVQALL